jgi:hypothetical protein
MCFGCGPAIITVHFTGTGSFGIITRHHNVLVFVAFVHFQMQFVFVLRQKLEVQYFGL